MIASVASRNCLDDSPPSQFHSAAQSRSIAPPHCHGFDDGATLGNKAFVLFYAAFRMLEPELAAHLHAPKTPDSFISRLISPAIAGNEKQQESPLASSGKFLTCAEAAQRLGVCRKSMENWARSGKIESFRRGRCIRIPESAIAALVTKRDQGGRQ